LVLLCILTGCGPELPPFRIEHGSCELYTDAPVTFSDALPREHCAFGDRLSTSLGLPIEAVPLRYGLFDRNAELPSVCADGDVACANGGTVISTEPLHLHELVHAHLIARGLSGTRALQEGAAMVHGCTERSSGAVLPELTVEQLVESEALYAAGSRAYGSAMSFVSFLLGLEGEATFVELMRRTNEGTRRLELDAILLALYGSDAAELLAQWTALGPQPGHRLCRRVYECAAPAWTGDGVLELERGIADDLAHAGAIRTLTVEREATLRIHADVIGAEVTVLSCDRGPDVIPEAGRWSASDDEASIAPGRYAIWITGLVLEGDQGSVEADVSIAIE
jgi:hypothetical protein